MSRYKGGKNFRGLTVEVKFDDFSKALRNFSKKVNDTGLLKEVRERMSYEPPAVKKQRLKKQARKRWERAVEGMIELGSWHRDKPY
jgi:ribosomal protein S21